MQVTEIEPGVFRWRMLPGFTDHEFAEEAAYHEAGHAVAALLTGHPLLAVELDDDPRYPRPFDSRSGGARIILGAYSIAVEKHWTMLWAGQQATLRWLRETGRDTLENRGDVLNLARDDAKRACSYGPGAFAATQEADRLLDYSWAAVCAVARRLLIAKRLTGAEVAELARRHGAPSSCWPATQAGAPTNPNGGTST